MSCKTFADECHADVVHSVLADRERRAIVQDLAANGASSTIPKLLERVATAGGGPPGRADRGFHLRLYHQHLPKMADAGVVEYEPDGRVTLTTTGRRIETVRKRAAEVLGSE